MNTKHGVAEIVNKLIQLSKDNELSWVYLEDNDELLKVVESSFTDYVVDYDDSFNCSIDNGFFAIVNAYQFDSNYERELSGQALNLHSNFERVLSERAPNLYRATLKSKKLTELELPVLFLMSIPALHSRDKRLLNKHDEHQGNILRLQNIAKRQYPNSDDFIDKVMAM